MRMNIAIPTDMTASQKQFDSIVVGLGRTGLSLVKHCLSQGRQVAAVDSRMSVQQAERIRDDFPGLAVFTGEFDADQLCRARELLLSPGVPLSNPAIQAAFSSGVRISSDMEIFRDAAQAPIVAITGSNGKSTVATLLSEMITASGKLATLAGNIGTPVLSTLDQEKPDYYVLEVSSFQLDLLSSLNAAASVVLNVSADHMDRYESIQSYAAAKQKIYRGAGARILNRDDELVMRMQEAAGKSLYYSLSEPADGEFGICNRGSEQLLCFGTEALMPVSHLRIQGAHNISNALAALALGSAIKLPVTAMVKTLEEFAGLPHRCQWLLRHAGVDWYNDSKGTNVAASCAAIEGLASAGNLVLIAGGDGKGADFTPLANVVRDRVRAVVLTGRDAAKLERALRDICDCHLAMNMEAAVSTAAGLARQGDRVLLSPACASQDMFRDYQHRGDVYHAAVRALAGEGQ